MSNMAICGFIGLSHAFSGFIFKEIFLTNNLGFLSKEFNSLRFWQAFYFDFLSEPINNT